MARNRLVMYFTNSIFNVIMNDSVLPLAIRINDVNVANYMKLTSRIE